MANEITFEELKLMVATKATLFDVRTPQEIKESGKIDGSINIPIDEVRTAFQYSPSDFKLKYGVRLPSKDDTIIFYCYSGKRSLRAVNAINELGFHNARYYPSGYGKYVELLSEEISFNDLQRLLSIDEVKLIDVRTPKEIQEHGKIEGSTNIPIDQIKEAFQLNEKEFTEKYGVSMPKKTDKNIVFHCGSGKRSRRAIDYVKDLGYSARHYPYGYGKYMEELNAKC